MKKSAIVNKIAIVLVLIALCCSLTACFDGMITESNFFRVMTAIQYYPSDYVDMTLEFDCFTYELVDVHNVSYICGVRQCSSGYGCVCGNDTIIGFVLEYDGGELPEPKNQSNDKPDKTWVHLSGKLKSTDKIYVEIYSYTNGKVDTGKTEKIQFLVFVVDSFELIEDYSNLNYYVTN